MIIVLNSKRKRSLNLLALSLCDVKMFDGCTCRPGSRCHVHYVWAAVVGREGGEEGLVVGGVLVLVTWVLEAPMVLGARVPMVLAAGVSMIWARVPMVLARVPMVLARELLVSGILLVRPHLPHRSIWQQT